MVVVKRVFSKNLESWLNSKNRSYHDFELLKERCEQEMQEILEEFGKQE